jgi:hypothetical protein
MPRSAHGSTGLLSHLSGTLALAGLLMTPVACHNGTPPATTDDDSQMVVAKTTLEVTNQWFADMTIYVVHSGQRLRLGLATGDATTDFVIPSAVVNGPSIQLRFVADPVGGTHAPVSDEITVSPGDSVQLTIPPG